MPVDRVLTAAGNRKRNGAGLLHREPRGTTVFGVYIATSEPQIGAIYSGDLPSIADHHLRGFADDAAARRTL
jgi:hypothetical protein